MGALDVNGLHDAFQTAICVFCKSQRVMESDDASESAAAME